MNDKLPPHDTAAEESLVGALLIDGETCTQIAGKLSPEDFYHEPTRKAYAACLTLRTRGEAINQVTLAQELLREGFLEICGGASYLGLLIARCPSTIDIEDYAQIIRRLSVSRQTLKLARSIAEIGRGAEANINEGIEKVTGMVQKFNRDNTTFDAVVTPKDAADLLTQLYYDYNNPKHSFNWGFLALDEITSGIYPELYIIGSRPGVGKTQIMLDIAENLWDKSVLFCTAEMSTTALLERKLARTLRVDIKHFRRHGFSEAQERQVMELCAAVSEQQIYYLPKGSSSQDIYNEAKKMKETVGLDIVFVDYLQMLSDCWKSEKENQNIRVGKACKMLKSLVTDLEIPVVVASQLNRGLEQRVQKRPTLADLRDSGEIEQDADVVFLLYRSETRQDVLEMKMAKNRQLGQADAIYLQWVSDRHCYGNQAYEILAEEYP